MCNVYLCAWIVNCVLYVYVKVNESNYFVWCMSDLWFSLVSVPCDYLVGRDRP